MEGTNETTTSCEQRIDILIEDLDNLISENTDSNNVILSVREQLVWARDGGVRPRFPHP